jgi:hypothetical protein
MLVKVFSAVIYKLGINPVVDPPDEVLAHIFNAAGREKGPIPVCGKINGAEFMQTLVKYAGAWRLYVNGKMLNDSGLTVGDTANIEIAFDPQQRETPVPPQFKSALESDAGAFQAFEKLTPSRKKEILRYLGNLKTQEALNRNIDRILHQLKS